MFRSLDMNRCQALRRSAGFCWLGILGRSGFEDRVKSAFAGSVKLLGVGARSGSTIGIKTNSPINAATSRWTVMVSDAGDLSCNVRDSKPGALIVKECGPEPRFVRRTWPSSAVFHSVYFAVASSVRETVAPEIAAPVTSRTTKTGPLLTD